MTGIPDPDSIAQHVAKHYRECPGEGGEPVTELTCACQGITVLVCGGCGQPVFFFTRAGAVQRTEHPAAGTTP